MNYLILFIYFFADRCECKESIIHYEEINCKPIYKIDTDCCPTYYDCDEYIQHSLNDTYCYLNSTQYKIREKVDSESLTACRPECFCEKSIG